jgi:hypothetical protein
MPRQKAKDTQEYWEALLIKKHLGMGVGTSSKLSYGGSGSDLEFISGAERMNGGRVHPSGYGADSNN